MARLPESHTNLQVFGLLYLGAALTAALAAAGTPWAALVITAKQAIILLYLGVIASGLGFFLWNIGARRVSSGTLAVFNNLKIPLGILVSVFFFRETADWPRLLGGGALMALALAVNAFKKRTIPPADQNKQACRLT
jgi:drug/metabolite transporter (DMT)-like permease